MPRALGQSYQHICKARNQKSCDKLSEAISGFSGLIYILQRKTDQVTICNIQVEKGAMLMASETAEKRLREMREDFRNCQCEIQRSVSQAVNGTVNLVVESVVDIPEEIQQKVINRDSLLAAQIQELSSLLEGLMPIWIQSQLSWMGADWNNAGWELSVNAVQEQKVNFARP